MFVDAQDYLSAFFGEGYGPVLLDYVNCNGDEASLLNCEHVNTTLCDHSSDTGVDCKGKPIRLVHMFFCLCRVATGSVYKMIWKHIATQYARPNHFICTSVRNAKQAKRCEPSLTNHVQYAC